MNVHRLNVSIHQLMVFSILIRYYFVIIENMSVMHTFSTQHIQNMDRGPWTTPWTTLNFLEEIASVNMKIYQSSGYEKHYYLLLMSLRVCLVNSGLLWDQAPINWRPQTCFKIQKIWCISAPNIFIPTIPNCNLIGKTPTPPPPTYNTCA